MDKRWIVYVVIVSIIGLAVGIGIAVYLSNRNETDKMDIISYKELANEDNEIEDKYKNNESNVINIIETSANEDNISPNAMLIKKIYYEECDHLIRKNEDIPQELINKSEIDVQNMFPDYEIEEYSPTKITLYKKDSGNCGEHYFIQDHNGVIGIYTFDKYGVKTLKEDTDIATQYLPEEDLQNLKAGVEITGRTQLIAFLEDYE